MKRLVVLLALLASLIVAQSASAASATWPGRDYARVKLWNGSDCGPNSGCQFVTRRNVSGETRVVQIGNLTTNGPTSGGGNCTFLFIYPQQTGSCYINFYFVSNAWTDHWYLDEGDSITAYARQPCPTPGTYHFSELKPFYQPYSPFAEWLGTLTIQSGCQTQAAPLG